jgi:FkbM family methyltransferase
MLRLVNGAIRGSLRRFGYDICWAEERRDPYQDMRRLVSNNPLIFDVGANLGQTIEEFSSTFNAPTIHAFEPGDVPFEALQRTYGWSSNIILNHIALGARAEERPFFVHTRHNLSSFLESGPDIETSFNEGGKLIFDAVTSTELIEIHTVDDYCANAAITNIDILKIDTQGFDLEVLKGSERILQNGGVKLIFLEINFAAIYRGLPPVDEVLCFLRQRNFELMAFYRLVYKDNRIIWTDGLFRHTHTGIPANS